MVRSDTPSVSVPKSDDEILRALVRLLARQAADELLQAARKSQHASGEQEVHSDD